MYRELLLNSRCLVSMLSNRRIIITSEFTTTSSLDSMFVMRLSSDSIVSVMIITNLLKNVFGRCHTISQPPPVHAKVCPPTVLSNLSNLISSSKSMSGMSDSRRSYSSSVIASNGAS